MVTAASIHCCLANGKSSGVRLVVALSQLFEGSLASHCCHINSLLPLVGYFDPTAATKDSGNVHRQSHPRRLIEFRPVRIRLACTNRISQSLCRGRTSSKFSLTVRLGVYQSVLWIACYRHGIDAITHWTSSGFVHYKRNQLIDHSSRSVVVVVVVARGGRTLVWSSPFALNLLSSFSNP
jgi:hypothetical protein